MAADDSSGFFTGVWPRLRAAASSWRRRGDRSGGDDDDADGDNQGEEATVKLRLARRATKVARVGRNLAFVSFNLEVLVFVYAFWRARRRNLTWRQPIQALPMLVIPALATLIYAAFIRFARRLDLKDKKMLERLQEEKQTNDCVPREFDQNEQNSAKKYDVVDDASKFSASAYSAETSKLGKHHQPSISLRDDGGGDMSWGHSNDFQPMRSDSLRRRRLSIEKTYMTNSSAFSQPINWSSEHLADDLDDPDCIQRTVEHHSNSGADVADNGTVYSSVETSSCIPGCNIVHMNSNATDRAECTPPLSSPKSNGELAQEDAVQIALAGPKSDLPAFAEFLHEVVEEKESSKFHVSEENRASFILEKELLVSPSAVKNIEQRLGTSGFTLCSQGTEKEDVAGGVCFIKVSPELSFLSSQELVLEGSKDASDKESCELNTQEENNAVVNSEEEALHDQHVVSTAEQCSGTSGFFLRCQGSNTTEVPAIVNFFAVSHESNYPAPVESLAEDDEDSEGDETSDVHLPEQKGQEAFPDPFVVDSYEDPFATSEFLSQSEAAKVLGFIKEDLSESQDEVASSYDGCNTENMIGDSVSVQLIPEANIMEALQGGQETLSDPLHHSSCDSAGLFVSSSEISNDEAYSSNSNSYFLYANSVEEEAPIPGQGGYSESKDEMFLDTPILLNEVTSAASWTDNAGCSRFIPNSDRTQSLHDGKRAPPKRSERANVCLEESFVSSDQEIHSENFSLYSRSSSCVSEVNMIETLRGGAFPIPENDERNPVMVPNVNHAENYTNNARSADSFPEINMTETRNVGKEATIGSVHEVSSNFVNSLRAPDAGNDMEKFDNYIDLLSSSAVPVVDAFEGLQAGQGFSEEQCENDLTVCKTKVFPKVKNDENYLTNTIGDIQECKERSIDALQSAQPGLSKSQDEGVFTLHGTYMSPDGISNAGHYLTADYASDIRNTMGSHRISQNASPESQPQDHLSFKEAFVYPDELCLAENNSGNAKSSLCSAEVNLIEFVDSDQRGTPQQQDENNLGFEDIYMAHQCGTSENRLNDLRYQHISDANIVETIQGAERLSSEILHDGIFSIVGTSTSLDGGNKADNSSNNSGSTMHTATILLGLQEGNFKPQDEKAMAISQDEVDSAETNCPNCTYAEATMTGAVEDVNKPPSHSQDEHPGTYISSEKGKTNATNHSNYSRSSSSMPDDNLIEISAVGQEGSLEPNNEYPSSFEKTSISENSPNNPTSVSHTSMKESVIFSGKRLPDPLLEDVHRFDKISGDERANKSLNENGPSYEQIAITQAEVNYTESQDCTEASNLNCTEASESVSEGFFEPEQQGGPELALSQVEMPFFIDEDKGTGKDHNSCIAASSHHEISILETLQELPIAAGSEKGFPDSSKACEPHCTDKELKDLKINDMKEDVEDLDEDHENNPIDLLGASEITPALAQKPSVKLYAKDASWRDLAMGTSNDFEAARVDGLRQRKPIFTISSGTGSSTVSELDDMQYTEPVDDDTSPLSTPLPSSVDVNTQNRSNDKSVCISAECSPTEQPGKRI
ncbi:uncharacterized protein LOC133920843 [Phragmites australis]|uniref:uncharacterized protein LOC133920843 n=1 Tax=Phragmites australis TaxID=29695 RepID=UPI002D7934C3|nr:uncharacterized protein LOC133920843 [Phragmites australis]